LKAYFEDKEPIELRRRAVAAVAFAAAVFFLIAVRFWYLQVKEGGYYGAMALNNSIRLIRTRAPRGLIFDRTGVKIAENRPGFDLYVVPEDLRESPGTIKLLSRLVRIDTASIYEKIRRSKGRPPYRAVKLKEDLDWAEAVRIESFKFEMPGVRLDVAPKRSYLYGAATAHVIGYLGEVSESELKGKESAGYDPGDLIGKYGLEKAYEAELRGVEGAREIEVDALGRLVKVVHSSAAYPGNEFTLTIDIATQMAAWDALKNHTGAAVAIEPSTGRILAMVSTPSFDANLLSSGISHGEWKKVLGNPGNILNNRAIQGLYPPASTFKPIHAAAALEEGVISPSTVIYSGPSFRFAGREYRDWREQGHGEINVHRAIVESSDTFFYQLGLKLGVDNLARYSKRFGFGAKTGVELINEKSGTVPSKQWKRRAMGSRWYEGETISVAVGQGYMLSTPLQLANAYAAIANGGTLYRPQLVEQIRTPGGEIIKRFAPSIRRRLGVSPENLERVKAALRGVVVEKGGTAGFLRWSRLGIAGKTGTAQVTRLVKREKDIEKIAYRLRDHAWFVGFAPFDAPKIAVAVIVEHGGFGSSAAAPVALKIFKAYLKGSEMRRMRQRGTVTAAGARRSAPHAPESVASIERTGSGASGGAR